MQEQLGRKGHLLAGIRISHSCSLAELGIVCLLEQQREKALKRKARVELCGENVSV